MKYLYLLIITVFCNLSFAQTQQGLVKTRGRMVNGQLVTGAKLSGVNITLNYGNSLVSGSQGSFSFNVPPGKKFSLISAIKKGYTLCDPEYTKRSFSYSQSDLFYVVLDDENQHQADVNASIRKVRKTLTEQLLKREEEIENLKAQNLLTEKEYQDRLQELYDNQSKAEQLVKKMAELYVSIDYDQLDKYDQQIQMYIEEGNLQKADSMILGKGDIEQRVADYYNSVKANENERLELNKREAQLEKSELGVKKKYEELSQDLYRRYEIFMQQFQQDSALKYLKIRADLDTTNLIAVWNYAHLCSEQKKYSDCEKYYLICLRGYMSMNEQVQISYIQHNLGSLYENTRNFVAAENHYLKALEIKNALFKKNPEKYRDDIAITQNSLGVLYWRLHNYSKSEKFYKLALDNREKLFKLNPKDYRISLADTQNNLGILYRAIKDYANSEKFYILSIKNKEQLFNQNKDVYRDDLASSQNNLAIFYYTIHDYLNSEKYFILALNNYDSLYIQNQNAYLEDLAMVQSNIGSLYQETQRYDESENFLKLALSNYEKLYIKNSNAYRDYLAATQHSIAILYLNLLDYKKSELYCLSALDNFEQLFMQYKDSYLEQYAGCYNLMANIYLNNSEIDKAFKNIEKAINLCPNNAEFYDTKGEIYITQGQFDNALKMWNKIMELNSNYLQDYPDGTNLSNRLKKLNLIN